MLANVLHREGQVVLRPGVAVEHQDQIAADDKKHFDIDPKDSTLEKLNWTKVTWEFTATTSETTLEIYTTEKGDSAQGSIVDEDSVGEM